MSVAESDQELSRLGFLFATTHLPLKELAKLSELEQYFAIYWVQKVEEEKNNQFWERFSRNIGTLWFKNDFEKQTTQPGASKDRFFSPLLSLMNPEVIKSIQKYFEKSASVGDVKIEAGEELIELGEMDAREAQDFMEKLKKSSYGSG